MVRNTPAVTKVEEWTRADTGVGAAIAAGNHLEKGICALFVILAKRMHKIINKDRGECHILIIDQWLLLKVQPIAKRSKTSPIRFVKAVIMPAPKDLAFW